MALPEDAPAAQTDTELTSPLGDVSLGDNASPQDPLPDIRVDAIEPASYAPARAIPYEGPAKRGPDIGNTPAQAQEAISYAEAVFPGSTFSFLDSGRYGIVLADDMGRAYKVYRSAVNYSRYEKEAGALQLLSNAGLAPKLHLFVDAGEEYRLDRKAFDYTRFGFEDVQIPRQNSGRELPVLVMDSVDVAPLENAEPAKLIDGFCRVASVFMKEGIYSWDAEVTIDKRTGEAIILDVGELYQRSLHGSEASHSRLDRDLEVLRGVCIDFGMSKNERQIQDAYRQGGIEAVRHLLTQLIY
jgi:hypothetical protein